MISWVARVLVSVVCKSYLFRALSLKYILMNDVVMNLSHNFNDHMGIPQIPIIESKTEKRVRSNDILRRAKIDFRIVTICLCPYGLTWTFPWQTPDDCEIDNNEGKHSS